MMSSNPLQHVFFYWHVNDKSSQMS